MADLAIWSDNERIDSEAVLHSVWTWIRAYPVTGLTLLGYLFAIVHRRHPDAPDLDLQYHVRYENAMTRIVRSVQKKQVDMTFDGCIWLGSGFI